MTKKMINQNSKYKKELINTVESKFIFSSSPLNRFKVIENPKNNQILDKKEQIIQLRNKLNSIEDCVLKQNSKNLILGDGNLNSSIMLIGEAPGPEEDTSGKSFKGETGDLLDKMLGAINIQRQNIYLSYAINFRPPEDRKPTSQEIKRYSRYVKEHISIIDPKIVILMGSTAMEAVTSITNKISSERGNWKEIIIENKTYPLIITFNPSYLIRFPENKKHSWEDLKKLRKKIEDLKLKI
ncbi:MAG: uracil-DNA glycosylase [Candidatus Pelagibacter sp.]|mgnify:CR=1 FL=1|jgi:uracil-DNA glycosylase family 4|nr:uracil-DNA glycosylase [Pseudomonadota bacterium]NCX65829.1 uracil-DNA glycosylase [Pseudomonadota bacterium]